MISNFLGTEIQFVLKLLGKNEKERERKKTVMNVSCFVIVQITTGLER